MDFEVGQVVGDYEILAVLGAGGMGKVYKVRNTISHRIEAMKVLLARRDEDPNLRERFSREIKITASLKHPNIAGLHTALRIGNQLAMIMEFIEGSTLDSRMRTGVMPLAQILEVINQSLTGLAYAHSQSVVHRDIKPANIMITADGRAKLMDFGIARMAADQPLTMIGQTMGSFYYMSPEQIEGKRLNALSDIYSLGVSLYEMVTSKKPFDGDCAYSVLEGHLHQVPRPPIELAPSVPLALSEIILTALQKDPARRFQSAKAFRRSLSSVAAKTGTPLSASTRRSCTSCRSKTTSLANTLYSTGPIPVVVSQMSDVPSTATLAPASAATSPLLLGGTGLLPKIAEWLVVVGLVASSYFLGRGRADHQVPGTRPTTSIRSAAPALVIAQGVPIAFALGQRPAITTSPRREATPDAKKRGSEEPGDLGNGLRPPAATLAEAKTRFRIFDRHANGDTREAAKTFKAPPAKISLPDHSIDLSPPPPTIPSVPPATTLAGFCPPGFCPTPPPPPQAAPRKKKKKKKTTHG